MPSVSTGTRAREAVRDLGDDSGRVQVGEDAFGHSQQLALAVELSVEGVLAISQALGDLGVGYGLGGDGSVDAEVAQVVRLEAVDAQLGEGDDADGVALVAHRRHQHRFVEVLFGARHMRAAWVAQGIG